MKDKQMIGISAFASIYFLIRLVNLFSVLHAVIFAILLISLLYVRKIWCSYQFFKNIGIQTPKYEFFYGNNRQFNNKESKEVVKEWTKKYGKTFGYYDGHMPILVTSDLDMIQEVFIKQFSNFSARRQLPLSYRDNDSSKGLFFATKSNWKKMRVLINPSFSQLKLKETESSVNKCLDRLVDALDTKKASEFVISDHFKRFTMDSICNGLLGFDTDFQSNSKNELYHVASKAFHVDWNKLSKLSIYFHELKHLIADISLFALWLIEKVNGYQPIIKYFRVQNMVFENVVENYSHSKINNLASILLKSNLNSNEIKDTLAVTLLAGRDGISNTLEVCIYILAMYPEEQLKLLNEITYNMENNLEEINIDTINNLEYLDMFVKEVLRLYPLSNLSRRCTNATNVKGIDIPLDMSITVDVFSIHSDPEIWGPVDPQIFYPPRFSPEIKRHPCAFLGFGIGPRNCVGMKFAIMEMKMTLVQLVRRFDILKGANMPDSLEFVGDLISNQSPKNGISVVLKERILS